MLETILQLDSYLPKFLSFPLKKAAWCFFWKVAYEHEPVARRGEFSKFVGSERVLLTETISNFYPFTSLLEIGCSYGQNFHLLAKIFPKVSMTGIDIDPDRVVAGGKLLAEVGFSNVSLIEGDARKLDIFEDKSVDVVFTSACLLYALPDEIETVLKEMLRIARKGVVMLEQHREKSQGPEAASREHRTDEACLEKSLTGTTYWLRDYHDILKALVDEHSIRITKIPSPLWTSEQWQKYGVVVEVVCG